MAFLDRKLRIRIVSANISQTLSAIAQQGIELNRVHWMDELTVSAFVSARRIRQLKAHLESRGETLQILGAHGAMWRIWGLKGRPVLLAGMGMFLLLSIWLPMKVLFIQVEGNHQVSDRQILQCAQQYGVFFGANRRQLRSEVLKNGLLEQIPQLQWAGVNTKGCVAVISVREKPIPQTEPNESFSNIVASCDGIIRSLTVTKGTPVCTVGQAVEKGQLLVSGYTDCGLKLLATGAQAEVFADTNRSFQAMTPTQYSSRREVQSEKTQFSLQIGKKLIKFYNSSRISLAGCDTICKRDFLTLPGGFTLPVAWITERVTSYQTEDRSIEDPTELSWLRAAADAYLTDQLLVGRIMESAATDRLDADAYALDLRYSCYEMIGKVSNKEIIKQDE